jgi:hypothetical protein
MSLKTLELGLKYGSGKENTESLDLINELEEKEEYEDLAYICRNSKNLIIR